MDELQHPLFHLCQTQLELLFFIALYINIRINAKILIFHKKINKNEKILYKTSYFIIKRK